MRIIDADALLLYREINGRKDYTLTKDVVNEAPTVDAEPVVRCKDCKYFGGRNDKPDEATAIGYCENPRHFIIPCRYDFFCADGERKEQNDGEDDD